MGKNDNIKRAKKLREAKRKREQKDEIIASGNGPAGNELRKRIEAKGIELRSNPDKIKYSELLQSFVAPILLDDDKISVVKSKFSFGIAVWNLSIIKDKSEADFLSAKKDLLSKIPDSPTAEELFDEMVKLKQEEFSEYKNFIVDFEIKEMNGLDYELTVAMAPTEGKNMINKRIHGKK